MLRRTVPVPSRERRPAGRWRRGLAVVWVILLPLASPARADDRTYGVRTGDDFWAPMTFRYEDRPFGGPVIWAVGEVDADSAAVFATFLAAHAAAVRPGVLVALHSPGGDADQGIGIGRLIRAHALWTVVAQPASGDDLPGAAENGLCASACSLAFLGGVRRQVWEGSRYGVHDAARASHSADDFAQGQLTAAEEAAYMAEMGVAPALAELKNHYDSSKGGLLLMTPDQMASLRVTTPEAETAWAIEQVADGFPLVGSAPPRLPGQMNKFRFQCLHNPAPTLLIGVDYVPFDQRAGIAQTPASFAAAVQGFRLKATGAEPFDIPAADVWQATGAYGTFHVSAFFRATAPILKFLTDAGQVRVEFVVPSTGSVQPEEAFDVDIAGGRERIARFIASCR